MNKEPVLFSVERCSSCQGPAGCGECERGADYTAELTVSELSECEADEFLASGSDEQIAAVHAHNLAATHVHYADAYRDECAALRKAVPSLSHARVAVNALAAVRDYKLGGEAFAAPARFAMDAYRVAVNAEQQKQEEELFGGLLLSTVSA
jgi:hypothetical protein